MRPDPFSDPSDTRKPTAAASVISADSVAELAQYKAPQIQPADAVQPLTFWKRQIPCSVDNSTLGPVHLRMSFAQSERDLLSLGCTVAEMRSRL